MFDNLEPQLLKPRVGVRVFRSLTHAQVKKVLATRRQKKYGFKDFASVVEQLDEDKYDVRIEYIY